MYLFVCRCCFCCAPTRLTHTDPCQKEMASENPSVSACGSPLGNPRYTHAHTNARTDKHPSRSSNWLTRRIAPCLTLHPLPGRVRFMSCPGFHFKETACCPIRSPPSTSGPLAQEQGLKMGHRLPCGPPHAWLRSGLGLQSLPLLRPTADSTRSLG